MVRFGRCPLAPSVMVSLILEETPPAKSVGEIM